MLSDARWVEGVSNSKLKQKHSDDQPRKYPTSPPVTHHHVAFVHKQADSASACPSAVTSTFCANGMICIGATLLVVVGLQTLFHGSAYTSATPCSSDVACPPKGRCWDARCVEGACLYVSQCDDADGKVGAPRLPSEWRARAGTSAPAPTRCARQRRHARVRAVGRRIHARTASRTGRARCRTREWGGAHEPCLQEDACMRAPPVCIATLRGSACIHAGAVPIQIGRVVSMHDCRTNSACVRHRPRAVPRGRFLCTLTGRPAHVRACMHPPRADPDRPTNSPQPRDSTFPAVIWASGWVRDHGAEPVPNGQERSKKISHVDVEGGKVWSVINKSFTYVFTGARTHKSWRLPCARRHRTGVAACTRMCTCTCTRARCCVLRLPARMHAHKVDSDRACESLR